MSIVSWTEDYGDDDFMGFDMSKLRRDDAYVNIVNNNDKDLYLYSLYKECFQCPFVKEFQIPPFYNATQKISTYYEKTYRILTEDVEISPTNSTDYVQCEIDQQFGEFGVYRLTIDGDCSTETLKQPMNIFFPMLTVVLIYIALYLAVYGVTFFLNRRSRKVSDALSNKDELTPKKARVRSLDTFRGISIVLMVFVNYGAGGYEFLEHAIWNGLNVADLVFPCFMWIMGVCIPISISSVLKRNEPTKGVFLNILRRSCILFALGIFLGGGKYLDRLRIFGVLQRFGICYFVVATICLLLSKPTTPTLNNKTLNLFRDIIVLKLHWLVIGIVFICHCLLTFLVAGPNCPRGYLGPGGNHENGKYKGCTGGATGRIDNLILQDHVYQWPTIGPVYQTGPFDPEGILGCLTSIVHVFLGVQGGVILLTYKNHFERLSRWLCWAALTGLIGGALCGFSKEDGIIPVNKNLWSISFVLVTTCFAFVLLSLCYYLVDVKRWWSGKPFLFAGMNAIIIYVGHSMTENMFPIRWVPVTEKLLYTHFLALSENVWGTSMWILVAYYLYKIKYFYSI